MTKLSMLLLAVALSTVGVRWIPLFSAGPTTIEVSNAGALLLMASAPVIFLRWRRPVYAPLVLNVFLLILLLLGTAFAVRDGGGTGQVVMSLAALLATYVLVNLEPLSPAKMVRVVALAFAAFAGFIVLSAVIAGVDLLQAVVGYVTTLDRTTFVFFVIRPMLNAFSAGNADYNASVINSAAAAFSLFFLLAGALAATGSRLMLAVAVANLLAVFVLFSSSAALTCALGGLVFGTRQFVRSYGKGRVSVLLFPALFIMLVPLFGYLAAYLEVNVVTDSGSRAERLQQYAGALALVDESPLLGAGFVEIVGKPIHNFLLFSWVSLGLVGLLLAGVVYLGLLSMVADGMAGLLTRPHYAAEYMMLTTLPILVLIRISVGGGGGLPAGAAAVALGIALLVRYRLRRCGEEFVLDPVRLVGPRRRPHRPYPERG